MSRPKSEDKRNAILAAATRVIASQGLGAATATIAHEAGVANGTLFTYFKTKTDLLNQLYLELKTEMAVETSKGMFQEPEPRERFFRVWQNGINWAVANPEKRTVMAQLRVSEEVTPQTRAAANEGMAKVGELLEQIRVHGPLSDAPAGFLAQIMEALADATIDYIFGDPDNAEAHCKTGLEAIWRVIGSS